MKIYVDADACPVVRQTEEVAKAHNIETILISDTNHIINSDYSQVIVVDKGSDSADFFIVNKLVKGDIVVTQDYGVAAMALGKRAYPIHQSGRWYTNDNIEQMLMTRHITKKIRHSGKKAHLKGPKKRTEADNTAFMESLIKLILYIKNK